MAKEHQHARTLLITDAGEYVAFKLGPNDIRVIEVLAGREQVSYASLLGECRLSAREFAAAIDCLLHLGVIEVTGQGQRRKIHDHIDEEDSRA